MTDHYEDPDAGRVHFSPALPSFGNDARKVRIVTTSIESPDEYAFALAKGELVLRHEENSKKLIRARFYEDSRGILVLGIQGYTVATDKPHNASFSFVGEEIGKLYDLLHYILTIEFDSDRKFVRDSEELRNVAVSSHEARAYLKDNEELIATALKSEVTKQDLVAVGYRKRQLEVFDKLINDANYFEDLRVKKSTTKEGLWQQYFEKNQWVFGYGLGYLFLSSLDDKKLEQVVSGFTLVDRGKRVDALMKTKGLLSNLCFVELKTHETPLLETTAYRKGCWAVSRDVAGAVSQIQNTVDLAVDTLTHKISPEDKDGYATGEELFNYQPKSFLVVGSLIEFTNDNGVNRDKLRSFELYRKNMINPEIITYDELYEKAKHIVRHNEN